jgi:hypothetical protein
MMIDWTHFTPLESAIGGVVIGAAASMLILFCGRVAGISGILGGVLSRANNDKGWRIAFLLGMVLSPVLWRLVAPLPAVSIGVLADAGRGRSSCRGGNTLRFRLYQRPRCVRPVASVGAFTGRHADLYGRRVYYRVAGRFLAWLSVKGVL